MSGRFVRSSKYRHVYGNPAKKEVCYDNVKVSNNAWDTNLLEANGQFLAMNWQASGGGAFALIPLSRPGKLPDVYPVCRGHTAAVLNTSFSPFDDNVIASGGDDAQVAVWKVSPDEIVERLDSKDATAEDIKPVATFAGGRRRVGHVQFHPTASNVLAAATGDHAIKLFDVEKQKPQIVLEGFGDAIQSMTFDWTGSAIAATCRDRKLRLFDTRTPKAVHTVDSHGGIKGARAVWCGDKPRLITSGFSKLSERQVFLWDVTQPTKPITTVSLDSSNGILMPFWSDNNIVFLAGKGDGNIRYFELESDELHYLTEYKSVEPQSGMAFLPRRSLTVDDNEIARMYKVTNSLIQPVSFYVPRKADSFQADIFPPAPSDKPALSADEFFAQKKTATPNLLDFADRSIVPSEPATPTLAGGASAAAPKAAAVAAEPKVEPKAAVAAEEPKAEPKAAEELKVEPKTAEEPKVTEPKAAEPKAAEPKAAEPKAEEPKAEEPKTEEPKAEVPKAAEPKAAGPMTALPMLAEESKSVPKAAEEPKAPAKPVDTPASEPRAEAKEKSIARAAEAADAKSASHDAPAPAAPAAAAPASASSAEIEELKAQIAERDTRIRELEMENLKLRTNHQRVRDVLLSQP